MDTSAPAHGPAHARPRFPLWAGAVAAALGATSLGGWLLGVPALVGIIPRMPPIHAHTALGLICAGVALILLSPPQPRGLARGLGLFAAALTVSFGAFFVTARMFPDARDIDQWLRTHLEARGTLDLAGSMEFSAAVCFVLSGLALLSLGVGRGHWPAQILAALAWFVALLAMSMEVFRWINAANTNPVPLPREFAFLLVTTGTLLARPDRGFVAIITSPYLGGTVARRLLVVAILSPFILIWARLLVVKAGMNPVLAGWLQAMGTMLTQLGLVVWYAAAANRSDARRREAEAARRQSERRFRALIEKSHDAITLHDAEGVIRYASPSVAHVLGFAPDELVETNGWALVHPEDAARLRAELTDVLAGPGLAATAEYRLRRGDGPWRWVSTTVSNLLNDPSVGAMVANHRDVTERKAAEEALRDEGERKDRFLAMLAHELRNPLAPVRNGLEILRTAPPDPVLAAKVREMMSRQVTHLTRIVDDLLDVSRITRGKLGLKVERVDLAALAQRAVEDHAPAFVAKGLTLRAELPDAPVWVDGDSVRLAQVLDNLLENARKFTDRGGAVVDVDSAGSEAAMIVTDTGAGFDSAAAARLFEPFEQLTQSLARTQGGLGLGLALVKGLAELHGGGVEAASGGAGHGARFTVRLPLAAERPAVRDEPPPVAEGPPLRVLVIEDNRDAADTLRALLELAGHTVAVAYDGRAGLSAALRERPDAVLCDIGLPDLDGYGVARELRRHPQTAATRLVALTGYGRDSDRESAMQAGFDAHLTKPAAPAELFANLRAPVA